MKVKAKQDLTAQNDGRNDIPNDQKLSYRKGEIIDLHKEDPRLKGWLAARMIRRAWPIWDWSLETRIALLVAIVSLVIAIA